MKQIRFCLVLIGLRYAVENRVESFERQSHREMDLGLFSRFMSFIFAGWELLAGGQLVTA